MKFVFALGLLVFWVHFCSPKIIGIPGMEVKRHPKPKWGECFRNTEIMCAAAGIKVQYDGENCVDCTCDGDKEGVTCCMIDPFPIVRTKEYCNVWLDTKTCYYKRTRKNLTELEEPVNMKKWKHACCIHKYEIANLTVEGAPVTWKPDNPKHKNH